ncbi:MAG: lysophospholipid acyltransferase family protein [Chloroherpetonaceae bacterium]|nr:lysophospholipid acyltransferase family protein [Chloroherpetonaceae bacterium]
MKKIGYLITYWLFLSLSYVSRLIPESFVPITASLIGRFLHHVLRLRLKMIESNLHLSFPNQTKEWYKTLLHKIYNNIALTFLEILRLPTINDAQIASKKFSFHIPPDVQNMIEKGQGGVVVSAHFSNWELLGISWAYSVFPLSIVYKAIRNPYLDKLFNQWRGVSGNALIEMSDASRLGMEAIRNGKYVVLLSDQSGHEDGVYASFLGREVPIFTGAALFALRSKSPMIFAVMLRKPDNTFEISVKTIPTEGLKFCREDVETLAKRYTQEIEKFIELHPEQWFWLHNRWKHAKD